MVGNAQSPLDAAVVLEARDVEMEFSGFRAIAGVSLKVHKGSVHGLIGPNGAGKTTLFNLLTRFLRPSAGQIFFDGGNITDVKPSRLARMGLVRSFQISATFANMSAMENVRVALRSHSRDSFDFWRSERVLDSLNERAMELLESVGLRNFADAKASTLSYGRKRALELATTLALNPTVMLLDEPTAGMGHEDVEKIIELVRQAARQRTVLMVEHNLNVVSSLCDRITVLARGKVLAEGGYDDVASDPRVVEAYIGHRKDGH